MAHSHRSHHVVDHHYRQERGSTPHEQIGSGTPIATARRMPQKPELPPIMRFTQLRGIHTAIIPAIRNPNTSHGAIMANTWTNAINISFIFSSPCRERWVQRLAEIACESTASDCARSTFWTMTPSGTESRTEVKFQMPRIPAATSLSAHDCPAAFGTVRMPSLMLRRFTRRGRSAIGRTLTP